MSRGRSAWPIRSGRRLPRGGRDEHAMVRVRADLSRRFESMPTARTLPLAAKWLPCLPEGNWTGGMAREGCVLGIRSRRQDLPSRSRRRVYAFSIILAYSRRQYVRFVEAQDFTTTIREHVRAFTHLGGAAATCLYDNMKVVVKGWDGEQPIYNTRFLAFATHHGFRPWACKRRRPRTKGKIERPFFFRRDQPV